MDKTFGFHEDTGEPGITTTKKRKGISCWKEYQFAILESFVQ